MSSARIASVNVVHALVSNAGSRVGRSAIDKRPVDGPVDVEELGLVGDTVLDRAVHGGRDKAVYAYALEDLAAWEGKLGRPLPPGTFGENLTTERLDVSGAVIGEVWELATTPAAAPVVLEVTMPRSPCLTFQRWMDEPHWVKRFTEHGAPGAYLRVLAEGSISAGAVVRVISRPDHGVTVAEVFARTRFSAVRRDLLLAQPQLAPEVMAAVTRSSF